MKQVPVLKASIDQYLSGISFQIPTPLSSSWIGRFLTHPANRFCRCGFIRGILCNNEPHRIEGDSKLSRAFVGSLVWSALCKDIVPSPENISWANPICTILIPKEHYCTHDRIYLRGQALLRLPRAESQYQLHGGLYALEEQLKPFSEKARRLNHTIMYHSSMTTLLADLEKLGKLDSRSDGVSLWRCQDSC